MSVARFSILLGAAALALLPTLADAADFDCGPSPTPECVVSHVSATARTLDIFELERHEKRRSLSLKHFVESTVQTSPSDALKIAGRIPDANDQIEALVKISETLLRGQSR